VQPHYYKDDVSQDDSNKENDLAREVELPPSREPPWKHFPHWKRWLAIVVAAIAGGLLIITLFVQPVQSAYSVMPSYLSLNGQQVAQVQVTATQKLDLLNVKVTLYDKDHRPTNDTIQCFIKSGDTLIFQGDVVKFAPWMNSLGLYSGYKLTSIIGCYSNSNDRDPRALLIPNNGEDPFFTQLQGRPWVFSTAEAHYSKPFSLQPAQLKVSQQTEIYKVYTSQTGLYAVLSK